MKIEDIREKQAAEAQRHIRAQFKMERIVYCQDDLYLGDLNTFKAENTALGKDLKSPVVAEMVSHTSAYFSVSSQAVMQPICCPLNARADTQILLQSVKPCMPHQHCAGSRLGVSECLIQVHAQLLYKVQ